jgi:hypothetical protein
MTEQMATGGLRHLALFYRTAGEYQAQVAGLASSALRRDEPVFIAVPETAPPGCGTRSPRVPGGPSSRT